MTAAVTQLPITTIATIAAAEYRKRQQRGQQIVRNRGMSIAEATRHLRPWLAIACLCGADLAELAQLLEDRRAVVKSPGDRRHGAEGDISPVDQQEREARWIVAEDVCPREHWVPILAAARDDAFNRYLAAADDAALTSAAAALQRICLHLAYDINGHHVPAYQAAVLQKDAA
ncbi:MAG: hypothetical protein Q8R81_09585 [Novosphingobium sp.]|uniref:hypothetical protein n=1 Tax=Novosphingobium sp. TaxID=1874826 RepID=UPI002735C9AF|nr:hypothetical protein [Novosphingobium sp.]MDP3550636.1 hypothetical protein [Novosphingobium sp.]